MVMLGNSTGTTPCPECGQPMGMVTWTGEKPVCPSCAGATTTGGFPRLGRENDEQGCLHEALERSLPPNQKGAPHNLVCNCPKCSITV